MPSSGVACRGAEKVIFCGQCGGSTDVLDVDGRLRDVCSACGAVLYRNPLPVAAAVVLNDKRQVLLIRRGNEPRKGLWCLPMGFAELNETIMHAALRELEEEAGITGRIVRLLSADSTRVLPYGDLLIITFEIEKTGGKEAPGDDAEDVAYFGIDHLPRLAFSSNQGAIDACMQAHREEWAIEDSFRCLSENTCESMLSDALVRLISKQAHEIGEKWIEDVISHPTTPTYALVDRNALRELAVGALSQFSRWLGNEENREVAGFYRSLGSERRRMGFGLNEVISSLSLFRKHISTYAMQHGVYRGAMDAYSALELVHRIVLFFDRAIYHTVRGFLDTRP